MSARFALGRLLITPAAQAAVSNARVLACLQRHARGDWGIVCAEDKAANDAALRLGSRILSAYSIHPEEQDGVCPVCGGLCESDARVWIITEADRASTTVLLPEDY